MVESLLSGSNTMFESLQQDEKQDLEMVSIEEGIRID
jgi:hypothetical protein